MAPNRLQELKLFCSMHSPDLLCITETWLMHKHLNQTLSIPGYQTLIRCDRQTGKGGGVAVYVRDGLAASRFSTMTSPTDLECISLKLDLPKRKKFYVFTVYRPPKMSMSSFLDKLDTALASYMTKNVCIVGDFNAKHSAWFSGQDTDANGSELKTFADCHNLQQLINSPTYAPDSGKPSLLDLIFTNQPALVKSTSVLPPIADHCAVAVHLSIKKNPPPKPFSVNHFLYDDADLRGLQNALVNQDWSSIVSAPIDAAVSSWTELFLSACCKFIPSQCTRANPSSKPWYSRYIRHLASYRDRLFKRARGKSSDSPIWETYRKMRNLFVAELRAAERRYFSKLGNCLLSCKTSPSRWWRLAKSACGWSVHSQIPALQSEGSLALSPSEKAQVLNSHFQSQCSAFPESSSLPLCPDAKFHFTSITPEDVGRVIHGLPSRKSPGSDTVTNELLKLTCSSISETLCSLFNKSLSEGIFPENWKQAIICPVLKNGKDSTHPASYRPVALLSSISKVFERLVHEQLLKYCLNNNILPQEQFGFLKGRSAEWQLLAILEDWHVALDSHKHVHAAFLDAAKAFDRVDHTILLRTLATIGIGGAALQWFQSYLSHRTICTKVSQSCSSPQPITSGVPQGSVLGPLLFIVHFKDLPSAVCASSALFADDSLLYCTDCSGNSQPSPCCRLQAALFDLSAWTTQTHTSLNPLKSSVFVLGPRIPSCQISLHGECLPRVSSTCHLGVIIENDLRWKRHIDSLIKSVSGRVGLCKLLAYRHGLPSCAIRTFYVTIVRPKLEYCSAAWCGASSCDLKRLEKIQVQAACAISRCKDSMAALQKANLPTLSWRRRIHCLLLLWRLSKGEGPPQLLPHLSSTAGSRSSRDVRAPHAYQFPRALTSRHLSSFLCVVIPIWNQLPSSLFVAVNSVSVFRSRLQRYFEVDKFSFGL